MIGSSVPSDTILCLFVGVVSMESRSTLFTKHVASVDDALFCFMSEEIPSKILFYSKAGKIVKTCLIADRKTYQ